MRDNTQELDVNKLEQIIADHNKEMRADMASEITGGTRSKSITDVITVKAILDWHNKQVEAVLDRLESQSRRADDCTDDTLVVKMIRVGDERNKLKWDKEIIKLYDK